MNNTHTVHHANTTKHSEAQRDSLLVSRKVLSMVQAMVVPASLHLKSFNPVLDVGRAAVIPVTTFVPSLLLAGKQNQLVKHYSKMQELKAV
eukprot:2151120-Amphidinium_carterae.2